MVFGLVMLYSASYTTGYLRFGDSLHYIKSQVLCLGLGLLVMIALFLCGSPLSAQNGLAGVHRLPCAAGAGAVQHAAERLPPLAAHRGADGAGLRDRKV